MVIYTNQLLDYKDFSGFSKIFIETGSAHGEGIQRALDASFETVISIEAHAPNYEVCLNKFGANPRVWLCFGRSQDMLPKAMESMYGPCVVFLDAHPSGPGTFGHEELMLGSPDHNQDNIIREELRIVLAHTERHVIIIDDVNGSELALEYARMIEEAHGEYDFSFYDENLNGKRLYKNKLLVAVPE